MSDRVEVSREALEALLCHHSGDCEVCRALRAEIEPKPEFVWVRMPRSVADGSNAWDLDAEGIARSEALARDSDLVPVWLTEKAVHWVSERLPIVAKVEQASPGGEFVQAARRALETS